MIVIGLTGSIGMGKTETTRLFKKLGAAVYDSDAGVHELYAPGGAAVEPVSDAFPGVASQGGIDRNALSEAVLGDPDALARLEKIVHPLVRAQQKRFLDRAQKDGADIAVLDIPLLFESGADRRVDVVVVVSAPLDVQRQRVLARPGMTVEKLDKVLARQTPDAEKRKRADYIVETHRGLDDALEQVEKIVTTLRRGRRADDDAKN